jgi:hypothetical protein
MGATLLLRYDYTKEPCAFVLQYLMITMPDLNQPFTEELAEIAEVIRSHSRSEAISFLRLISLRVAEQQAELSTPAGAPKPIPVPPEMVAEALREFNDSEITQAIGELRRDGGYQINDILPRLELQTEAAPRLSNSDLSNPRSSICTELHTRVVFSMNWNN